MFSLHCRDIPVPMQQHGNAYPCFPCDVLQIMSLN